MELGGLAAERRDADRVLEEAARVPVVTIRSGCGKRAQGRSDLRVPDERVDDRGKPGVSDLCGEELEEAVELVRVAPKRRREIRGIGVVDRLDCAHLDLELAVEALDATEHLDRVAFGEAAVQELDVVPDACVDATTRIRRARGRDTTHPLGSCVAPSS